MKILIDALRISPLYSAHHWQMLSIGEPGDWVRGSAIVRDRLEGRFLRFADRWIKDPFSGFVVLSIDCLLIETIQQFRAGEIDGRGRSKLHFTQFLSGPRFQPEFDGAARSSFYSEIRCGLLHQAEAKGMWLVRRKQA
jgi:hypothetical protein